MTPVTSIPRRRLRRMMVAVATFAVASTLGSVTASPALAEGIAVTGTPAPEVPGAPANLDVEPGDRVLTATFVPPAVNEATTIDGYEYSLDGGDTWNALPLVVTLGLAKAHSTVGEIAGVLNGQGYAVQVRALTNAGAGESTDAVAVQTMAWFHDPLSKKQRRTLVKVPATPQNYTGKPARTVALAASRDGSPAVTASSLAGRQLQEGQAVSVPASTFKPGSATLTPAGKALVGDVVGSLGYVGSVQCEGYADYAGGPTAAQKLAKARAAAVCQLLVVDGAAVNTWVKGYGSTWPLAIGGTPASRADNGRVVLLVLAEQATLTLHPALSAGPA